MPYITVYKDNQKKKIFANHGAYLQTLLREYGYVIYSPCGGKGKCGKCEVTVRGEGTVLSCRYIVDRDIDVILPDKRNAEILVSQYESIEELPFEPGKAFTLSSRPVGVAVDIGTTTIVFYFIDLTDGALLETRSVINPQINYGADVITRINYCARNPLRLKELQKVLISTFNDQFSHFKDFADVTLKDIVKITVAGNTTMLHLFAGIDPYTIAIAPYRPVFTERKCLNSGELGMQVHPDAEIILLPSVSAFIGADIVAGLASLKKSGPEYFLYIDIGTNGEIALSVPGKIWCCAAAAGPAFEGANITCGMGALEGAVSAFGNSGYHTIANGQPVGICGSGLVDIVAFLLEKNIINLEGYMENDFIVVPSVRSGTGKPIILTPSDVREVQLAKSAIMSGIRILFKKAGITVNDLKCVYIAGGFGNYISTSSAVKTGIIPGELENKVVPVGNASGTGAMLSLKSVHFDKKIVELLKKMEHIELSVEEDFPQEFAMNMYF